MKGIPLFKEEYRGFTICDQGYTIIGSKSYQTMHASITVPWCRIVLAVVWNVMALVGFAAGLWYNKPAIVLVSLALLGAMMWYFHPRKKKRGPVKGPLTSSKASVVQAGQDQQPGYVPE